MTPQLLSSSDIIMCSNSYDNSKSNVCPILQRLLGLDTQCHLAMDSPFIKQRPHLSRIRSRSKRRPFNRQLVNYGPVLLSLLVYLNTLRGDFVHDDIPAIVNNPDVNGKNSVLELFSNDFWGEPMSSVTSHKSYRPLTILLFRLNYFLGHGKSWPFHGTNLMLHGCATILLGCICNQVLQLQKLTCLITASLFAVHPIHTEAVSGLVGCADLLACNLTLMSFLAYTKYLENPSQSVKWHWLSLCAASGAVLSKETGIMALAINIGYGLWFKSKWVKKMKQVFWADVLTLTVLLSVRWIVQNSSLPEFSVQDNPAAFHKNPLTRTLTFLYLPVHNFWLLVCPNALSYDWQMGSIPLVHSFQDPRAALALPAFYGTLLLAAMSILYQRYGSKSAVMRDDHISNCLVVAYLFMILPFVPASNLFFPVGFVIAERILYLPRVLTYFVVVVLPLAEFIFCYKIF